MIRVSSDLRRPPIDWRVVAFAIALALYGTWLLRHRVVNPGGSDSSGYLNAARLLARGSVVVPIGALASLDLPSSDASLFIPLGYKPGPRPGTMVPYYPPGMPLHLVAAEKIAGWRVGPYLVSPLAAVVALLLTFLIARELGLGFWWAAGAAAILASFATFITQALQVMSDVLATAWCCAAIFAALRSRRNAAWAVVAGSALGVAVLVRPTSALFVLPLVAIVGLDVRRLLLIAVGGLPFAAFDFAYNAVAFGNPFTTGYSSDLVSADFRPSYFPVRFRHYIHWMSTLLTPLVPLGWLGACASRRPAMSHRLLFAAWVIPSFIFYCCYRHYDAWWYTRFLLPVTPGLVIAALFFARDVLRLSVTPERPSHWSAVARPIATVALTAWIVLSARSAFDRLEPADIGRGETVYRDATAVARFRLPDDAWVLAMQTSGTIEYYERLHPVRWDQLDRARLRLLESRFSNRDLHFYALLFPFEVEEMKRRVPGEWREIGSVRHISLWERE